MKKTIEGIISSKDLMKDIFAGMGYFVFAAGMANAVLAIVKPAPWFAKVSVTAFLAFSLWFAAIFWIMHVVRPVIQISWPEFKFPGTGQGAKRIHWKQLVGRADFLVFLLMGMFTIELGWYLVTVVLEKAVVN